MTLPAEPGDATASPKAGASLRYFLTLLAVLALGLGLRIFHAHEMQGTDGQKWITSGRELWTYPGTVDWVFTTRLLWSAVLHYWGELTSPTLGSSAILMYILGLLTALLVAQSGRLLFGPTGGIIAAAFYVTHPLAAISDTSTVSDNLANPVLAAYTFLFLKYLHTRRLWYLAPCALLIGLSLAVKEYYTLAAVPFGLVLLLEKTGARDKLRTLLLFGTGIGLGIAVDLILNYLRSGNPLGHFATNARYGEALAGVVGPEAHSGLQLLIRRLAARLEYLNWLIFQTGSLHGLAALAGIVFLLLGARRALDQLALAGLILVLLGFLMFMPVSIRPPLFVEMQFRYLMAILPVVALGVGGLACAALRVMPERRSRQVALALALVVACLEGLWTPGNLSDSVYNRGHTIHVMGIQSLLAAADQAGIKELALTREYHQRLPDEFDRYGVVISYFDVSDPDEREQLVRSLEADPRRVLFLPRLSFSELELLLRRGEYSPGSEFRPNDVALAKLLQERGLDRRGVRVPATDLMGWLARFRLVNPEQELVGWVYRHKPAG